MARASQLQWEPARGKWKIVYRGKKYRFDGGTGKSDRAAKRRAEAEWKAKKAILDHDAEMAKPYRAEYRAAIDEWTEVLTWSVDHNDGPTAAVARSKIRNLEERLRSSAPPPLSRTDRFLPGPAPLEEENKRMEGAYQSLGLPPAILVDGPVLHDEVVWADRLEAQTKRLDHLGRDDTFAANVEAFLDIKRNEVAAGQLSAARAESLRCYLDVVMDYAGSTASVSKIDAAMLAGFRNHLLEKLAAKEISDYYARDVFAGFKLFVRWLANNTDKLANLPRNIDDKRFGITIAKRKAKTLTIEQVGDLLKAATNRTRLYLLLGLNCAMTQKDMSDFLTEEVDWQKGIIRRKRSKTERCENVPEVSYKLWPPTMALLQQERSHNHRHAILNRDGLPLRTEQLTEKNVLKKTDAVRTAMRRLSQKTGITITVTMLKKTSASLLRNNRDYQGLRFLFLDHAPTSVADRHYTTVPQELLDEAIAWLGQELKIDEVWKDIAEAEEKNSLPSK